MTSSSEAKIARAVALGAKGGFRYDRDGWAAGASKEPGLFDVIVDSAGGAGFGVGGAVGFGTTGAPPPVTPTVFDGVHPYVP